MTRRVALLTITLLAVATGCSSDASSGGGAAATTTTAVAGDTTTTVAGDATTTTVAASATTVDPGPPTTPAATVAPPATPAATAAPTTVPCRNVGNIYGLVDVSGVNVRRGDCGEGVQNVQSQLNDKLSISLVVDGRFGPGTEAAVRDFQALVGLPVDGIVGPSTWTALTDDGT
jgi:peptidoglycan hydrolase-like protein with peptidoglycan-binding domain